MFKGIVLAFVAAAALLVAIFVAPLAGAFAGATVGYFFPETIGRLLDVLGFSGMAPWQLGFSLAFIGSFFRSYNNGDK